METRQRQSASGSFLPDDHGAGGVDDSTISADGGGGRPLFTPRVTTAGFSQHNSTAAAAASAAGGSPDPFPTRPSLRPRGPGGGGDGAGGDYRLMDSSGGASFMARSPGNMSVAMSLGSEDSVDADTLARTGGGQGGGGAGSPDGGVGDSFSDILSP